MKPIKLFLALAVAPPAFSPQHLTHLPNLNCFRNRRVDVCKGIIKNGRRVEVKAMDVKKRGLLEAR